MSTDILALPVAYQEESKRVKGSSLQRSERRLNVWHLEKDSLVRNPLVVEHQSDAPDSGREADVLDTSQIVQDNLRLST